MNIIDNSLCNIDFSENATDKQVREYIAALFECGADYIEVDGGVIQYIENVRTNDKFIFRMDNVEDLEILTRKSFAYVIFPVNMVLIAKKFTQLNSIIEIDANKYTLDDIVGFCRIMQRSSGISAIRITKSFKNGMNEIKSLLSELEHRDFKVPLDICPLNDDLNGVSSALYAYNNCPFGMVTLSFGSHYLYTPLESFILYLNSKNRESVNPKELQRTVAALYVAAARYEAISEFPTVALQNITFTVKNCDGFMFRVDEGLPGGFAKEPRRRVKNPNENKPHYSKIKQKYFDENDIDEKLCESISDAVDDANVNVYNNAYKKITFKI